MRHHATSRSCSTCRPSGGHPGLRASKRETGLGLGSQLGVEVHRFRGRLELEIFNRELRSIEHRVNSRLAELEQDGSDRGTPARRRIRSLAISAIAFMEWLNQ